MMKLFQFSPLVILSLFFFPVAGMQAKDNFDVEWDPEVEASAARENGLMHRLAQEEDFSHFFRLVSGTDLAEILDGQEPYTVFVPSNEAFESLPGRMIEALEQPVNRNFLVRLLSGHIMEGMFPSSDIEEETEVETISGASRMLFTDEFGFYVDGIEAADQDIEAENGVLHRIEVILVPGG